MGFEAEVKTVKVSETDGATALFSEGDALAPPDFYAYIPDRIYKLIRYPGGIVQTGKYTSKMIQYL